MEWLGLRDRIRRLLWRHAERNFKIRGPDVSFGLFLNAQFKEQHLIEQYLANLTINLPDLRIERRHDAFMFIKHSIGNLAKFTAQGGQILPAQALLTMALKKSS